MNCKNCGASHGCDCQRRVANDGTECCTKCVQDHNIKSPSKGSIITGQPSPNNQGTAPIIHSITYNKGT